MQFKLRSYLPTGLLLGAGLFLGLVTVSPTTETEVVPNGVVLNGANLNGVSLNGLSFNGLRVNGTHSNSEAYSMRQLQLEGSELVLHLNR